MKPEQIYQNLKDLAEKLSITISEQNLRNAGMTVRSGLCKVKGKNIFVMDKSLPIAEKNEILASCLREMPHDEVYVLPAVRELLNKH
jgi:hypothetical protein